MPPARFAAMVENISRKLGTDWVVKSPGSHATGSELPADPSVSLLALGSPRAGPAVKHRRKPLALMTPEEAREQSRRDLEVRSARSHRLPGELCCRPPTSCWPASYSASARPATVPGAAPNARQPSHPPPPALQEIISKTLARQPQMNHNAAAAAKKLQELEDQVRRWPRGRADATCRLAFGSSSLVLTLTPC